MMKDVRSDENYKIFLENEEKMASVFGVIHLCYAKRSNADIPPFHILPSVTTLVTCIRVLNAYIDGETLELPSQKTFHKIAEFFKQAYQLSEPSIINDNTLFEYHMNEILLQQGLTELKPSEYSFTRMPENWFAGRYYCYYEQYSAPEDFNGASFPIEIKGAILNVFQTQGNSYRAVIVTGFSDKEQAENAAKFIWKSNSIDFTNIFSTYKQYLKDKSSQERTIIFWSGKIEEQRNQIRGEFRRKSNDDDLSDQEILFSLFKHSHSRYDCYQGGIGVMVTILPKEEIGSSKFILSRNSLNWKKISQFLEKKQRRLSFSRSDDKDFLNIILASND